MHGRPLGHSGNGLMFLGRVQGYVPDQFAILTQDPDIEVAHNDDDPTSLVLPAHSNVVEFGPVASVKTPNLSILSILS